MGARLFLRGLVFSAAAVLLLVVVDFVRRPRFGSVIADLGFLLPAMIGMAVPLACLLGVVVAAHRHEGGDLPLRSLLGIAALAGLATFANLAWVTPEANYAFKLAAWTEQSRLHPEVDVSVFRGDREMTLHQLAQRSADLRDRSRSLEAGHYGLELHKMPAIGAWCLVLALVGAAVARGIRWLALRWGAALALCWIWFVLLRLGEEAADAGMVSAAVAMWAPVCVATALASTCIWRLGHTPRPSTA
jgi:lipopolysaccharide export LptBFGC system permease protein LptF